MFKRLAQGIARTRANLIGGVKAVLRPGKALSAEEFDSLETALLMADCGIAAATKIVDGVRRRKPDSVDGLNAAVIAEMAALLAPVEASLQIPTARQSPFVILIVGVNGAGKTTTIAKLGKQLTDRGLKVMFAGGDTFRAAAVEQLQQWGERLDIPVIAQAPGADPAAVIFDACSAAQARNIDVLIADTAGRLHTQTNLMAELEKVNRVIKKFDHEAPHETMLISDATLGQNSLAQARIFNQAVALDSISLTKLDGTAKGGIVFALAEEFKLPIRYVGIGEGFDDLRPFVAQEFAQALLAEDAESAEAADDPV